MPLTPERIKRHLETIEWDNLPVCKLDEFLEWNREVKRRSRYNRDPGVIVGERDFIITYIGQLMFSEDVKGVQGGLYRTPPERRVGPADYCADVCGETPSGLLVGYKIARVTPDYYVAFGNHISGDALAEACSACSGMGSLRCDRCKGMGWTITWSSGERDIKERLRWFNAAISQPPSGDVRFG
jgi:hypothetical protein